MAVKIGPVDF